MAMTSNLAEEHTVVNGVDVTSLGETLKVIRKTPEIAQFQFRNENKWIDGSLNRSTIKGFYGAGKEDDTRNKSYEFYADEPPVLLGEDHGANPVEYLLHALAGCMTTTMVYHAASQGIVIKELESSLEGDIDIRGFTGVSQDVPKGYSEIRVSFRAKTDADAEELKSLTKMSPVYNSIAGSVPVVVNVETY